MGKLDRLYKKTIFSRLLITFICIVIPMYVLGIAIYNWSVNTVRKEIIKSSVSQTTFYLKSLETEIERIKILQFDSLNDSNLNHLASIPESLDEIQKMEYILQLQKRLQAIEGSSQYINDVIALVSSIGKKIAAIDGVRNIEEKEFDEMQHITVSSKTQIIYYKDEMLLNAAYPMPGVNSKRKPLFVVSIDLSKEELGKTVEQLNTLEGSRTILMDNSNNSMLVGNAREHVDNEVKNYVIQYKERKLNNAFSIEIADKPYLVIYSNSNLLNMTLIKLIPENEVFGQLRKIRNWFYLFTLIGISVIIIYSFSTYRFVHKPIRNLVSAFRKVENGEFDIAIQYTQDNEFKYLYHRFNVMVKNLKTLIHEVYMYKILSQKAELKQLQSQINPHFLYNSFFILHRRIKGEEYDVAMKFSQELGKYFKFITRSAAEEVALSKEVDHAVVYAEIQSMSFSSRIKVEFMEITDEYKNIIVPRLILQPILENAFEHGLKDKIKDGILNISYKKEMDILQIVIEDNGDVCESVIEEVRMKLVTEDKAIENTGIVNIHKRLKLKFGDKGGIKVLKSELGGLKVVLCIPLA
jgi:two-component system, sensor histidine kinase YesM